MPSHKNPADKVASRGAKRMKEKGLKAVTVWLDTHELDAIAAAAAAGAAKLATWIRATAYHAAVEANATKRGPKRPDGQHG